jgi:hypothetical protein
MMGPVVPDKIIPHTRIFEYPKIADTIGMILIWNGISALKSEGILRN